jgi:tRNA(Ile)-lysidine synthase
MQSTGKNQHYKSPLEAAVASALAGAGVAPGARILVGVSGGPDSTALLGALAALRGRWRLILHACIVDHGIRSEAEIEGDIAFAHDLCALLEVPLSVARVPRGRCLNAAKTSRRSLEEVAREARLAHLREEARWVGAELMALGHTRDDVIETILMRVFQGSDAAGLAGIPVRRGALVRPLIRCTKAEALRYLEERGLGWRKDATNDDPSILRNRVRHRLVPALTEVFPGYVRGLLTLSGKLSLAAEVLDANASLLPWKKTPKGFTIPRDAFFSAPRAVRAASLLGLYDTIRPADAPRRLPWRFLAPALVRAALPRRGTILRGHGVVLSSRGESIHWEADIVSRGKKGYFIEVSGDGSFPLPGTGITIEVTRTRQGERKKDAELCLGERLLSPPIILRSRRKGDVILRQNREQSLKGLFSGWKVPEAERDAIPVLVDRRGVLAVMGEILGYENRVRDGAIAEDRQIVDRILLSARWDTEERREQQF